MKLTYVLMIEDQKKDKVEAMVHGLDACSVFIEAGSLAEAKRLLKKGEQAAAAALEEQARKWEEEDRRRVEEATAPAPAGAPLIEFSIHAYEQTEEGRRLLAELEDAEKLVSKYDASMEIDELQYILGKNYKYEACAGTYNLGYRRGYIAGNMQKGWTL